MSTKYTYTKTEWNEFRSDYPERATEEMLKTLNRLNDLKILSNRELSEVLRKEVWSNMKIGDPNADLIAEAMNRLFNSRRMKS